MISGSNGSVEADATIASSAYWNGRRLTRMPVRRGHVAGSIQQLNQTDHPDPRQHPDLPLIATWLMGWGSCRPESARGRILIAVHFGLRAAASCCHVAVTAGAVG